DEVGNVLEGEGDRLLRQPALQLAGGHDRAGNGQTTEQHFEREGGSVAAVEVVGGEAVVVFTQAHKSCSQSTEGVADGDTLRHGRHRHEHAKRVADGGTGDDADDDPLIFHDTGVE